MPQPDEAQRRSVLDKVLQTVDEKFMGPDTDTARLRQAHEEAILLSETPEQFEAEMNACSVPSARATRGSSTRAGPGRPDESPSRRRS